MPRRRRTHQPGRRKPGLSDVVKRRNRRRSESFGRKGETFAAWWFRFQGWRILDRRVQTPRGEIDIVMRRGRTVAFVEVKFRNTVRERDRSLDNWTIRQTAEGAEAVGHRYAGPRDTMRIDGILLTPWRWPRHLVNVWQP